MIDVLYLKTVRRKRWLEVLLLYGGVFFIILVLIGLDFWQGYALEKHPDNPLSDWAILLIFCAAILVYSAASFRILKRSEGVTRQDEQLQFGNTPFSMHIFWSGIGLFFPVVVLQISMSNYFDGCLARHYLGDNASLAREVGPQSILFSSTDHSIVCKAAISTIHGEIAQQGDGEMVIESVEPTNHIESLGLTWEARGPKTEAVWKEFRNIGSSINTAVPELSGTVYVPTNFDRILRVRAHLEMPADYPIQRIGGFVVNSDKVKSKSLVLLLVPQNLRVPFEAFKRHLCERSVFEKASMFASIFSSVVFGIVIWFGSSWLRTRRGMWNK